jgi:hypothetical protein
MRRRKAPSYTAVLESLKILFAANTERDKRSIAEIYVTVGREQYAPDKNRIWLRNKMTDIKYYSLARPLRSPIDKKTVEYVQLTARGKRALRDLMLQEELQGSTHDSLPVVPERPEPSLDTTAQDIVILRKRNPHLKIDFSIAVREEEFAIR